MRTLCVLMTGSYAALNMQIRPQIMYSTNEDIVCIDDWKLFCILQANYDSHNIFSTNEEIVCVDDQKQLCV